MSKLESLIENILARLEDDERDLILNVANDRLSAVDPRAWLNLFWKIAGLTEECCDGDEYYSELSDELQSIVINAESAATELMPHLIDAMRRK